MATSQTSTSLFNVDSFKTRVNTTSSVPDKHVNFFDTQASPLIAIDNSGSTSGSILARTKDIIAAITSDANACVLAWNSSSKFQKLRGVSSTGGTSPSCIFSHVKDHKNLLITTDGEISASDVNYVLPLIEKSSIVNVIAIYIGGTYNSPNKLNLPVFAPFQTVPGLFLLYHADMHKLRLLLKSGNGDLSQVPNLPEVTENSTWDSFPTIDVKSISKIQVNNNVQKVALREGEVIIYGDTILNLAEIHSAIVANPDIVLEPSFTNQLICEDLQEAASSAKASEMQTIRSIVEIWQKKQMENASVILAQSLPQIDEEMKMIQKELEPLMEQLQEKKEPQIKHRVGELTKKLYLLGEKKRTLVDQERSNISRFAGSIFQMLAAKQNAGFTLEDLARNKNVGSNRAKRAKNIDASSVNVESVDTQGSIVVECDICASEQVQGLICIKLSPEQTERNTSDFALDDVFSLGDSNSQFIPSSTLCLYCASFLLSNKSPCPYTRQEISAVIPVVKYSPTNYSLVKNILSMWLFGGKEIGIEYQLFLSIMDSVEGRTDANEQSRFVKELFEHWKQFILRNTKANFMGLLGKSKPILEAMGDVMDSKVDNFSSNTWVEPLRNKTITSITIMARTLVEFNLKKAPANKYQGIVFRVLVKSIVSRFLSICKKNLDEATLLKKLIISDLYDCKTGFPLINSGALCSFSQSNFIKKLFGEQGLSHISKQITRYCKAIDVQFEDFVKPVYITCILYHLNNVKEFCVGEEVLLCNLIKDCEEFNRAFFLAKKSIDAIKLLSKMHEGVTRMKGNDHTEVPGFSPCHLISPPITVCGICGEGFTSLEELTKQEPRVGLLDRIKKRRAEHLNKYFHGDKETGMVIQNSAHYNLHRAVSIVMQQYPESTLPTREMVEGVVRYLRKDKKGNIYEDNTLTEIASLVWDYVQKRSKGVPGRDTLNEKIMTEDRLKMEIEWVKKNGKLIPAQLSTFKGLSQEQINELTKPIDVYV